MGDPPKKGGWDLKDTKKPAANDGKPIKGGK